MNEVSLIIIIIMSLLAFSKTKMLHVRDSCSLKICEFVCKVRSSNPTSSLTNWDNTVGEVE